jgi:hypothetical protein
MCIAYAFFVYIFIFKIKEITSAHARLNFCVFSETAVCFFGWPLQGLSDSTGQNTVSPKQTCAHARAGLAPSNSPEPLLLCSPRAQCRTVRDTEGGERPEVV